MTDVLDLLIAILPTRDLGDGREAMVYPISEGRARIGVGPKGQPSHADTW